MNLALQRIMFARAMGKIAFQGARQPWLIGAFAMRLKVPFSVRPGTMHAYATSQAMQRRDVKNMFNLG